MFQQMCEIALVMLNAKKEKKSGIDNSKVRWKCIKCPQQTDDTSSGFYICRFMREIVEAVPTEIPTLFHTSSPQSYKEEDIFQVIEECIEFFRPTIEFELALVPPIKK